MEEQLWIVVDEGNHWLWYGRGSQQDAIEGAKKAEDYNPESTLYLYAISAEIVFEPSGAVYSGGEVRL